MSDAVLSRSLLTLGSLGLLLLFSLMLGLHPSLDVAIMAAGVLSWLFGNVLWLNGQPIYRVVHLWVTFLVLTIVGERLELSRVRRLTQRSERLLMLAATVYLVGALITVFNFDWGVPLLGFGGFTAVWQGAIFPDRTMPWFCTLICWASPFP
jgi:hypothetical protein